MIASFLIPVRDGAATIAEALASAGASTVEDVEIVVVDDDSTDETAEIVTACPDPRVRLLRIGATGIAGALNVGLAACRAPLVARLDADDLATPDRLAVQLPLFDARTAVVDGRVSFFRDGGEPIPEGMMRYEAWINGVVEPEDMDRQLLVESPVVHPAATLRRDAVIALGGYRDGPFPEDYDLWLRLHAAGWRLRKAPAVVVRQRDRPERLTRTDPRYGKAGLRRVRRDWLVAMRLAAPTRVAIVGAGDEAKDWIRWLRAEGHVVVAVIDVAVRRIGATKGGVPVLSVDALGGLDAELLLVAVGAWGARDQALTAVRASGRWREGIDAFAVC